MNINSSDMWLVLISRLRVCLAGSKQLLSVELFQIKFYLSIKKDVKQVKGSNTTS